MRRLTFVGFLKQYISKLSFHNTMNLRKLAEEVCSENHRLKEPLVLYCVFTEKTDLIRNYLPEASYYASLGKEKVLQMLQKGQMPNAYNKVWASYDVINRSYDRDDRVKTLMRNKILELQKEKGLSNSEIYKPLGLNAGNVNYWLKHGDNKKVSYNAASKILDYVENAEAKRTKEEIE